MPARLRQGLEALALLGIAWALSYGLGWHPAVVGFEAVAVALAAARFGFWTGAGAGVLAGAVHLLASGLSPAEVLSLQAARAPIPGATALLLLGAAIGLVADAQLGAIRHGQAALAALQARYDQLEGNHQVVVAAKEALDQRIVGQVQTITAMYEAAQELEVLDPEAILPATARLAVRFLQAEAVSIYRLEGFRLHLAAAYGAGERPEWLAIDDGPIGIVVRTGASAGVRTKADYARAHVLLAAPLKHADGQVRGVIAIERIPFHQLTPATAQMLELVADWSARALSNSEAYQASLAQQALHPQTGLQRVETILERLRQEWQIAGRYQLPLSVILLRQPSLLDLPPAERPIAALPLIFTLKQLLREVDQVGHYRTDDSFLLVLPLTAAEAAQHVAARLEAALPEAIVVASGNQDPAMTPETLLQTLQVLGFDLQDV